MEIRQLTTFVQVAGLLSFYKAAQHLHYAQSSVSAQIQSLEEELGVRLFDRLGRSIQLTDAGKELLPYAQKILNLDKETHAAFEMPGRLKGSLTIRIPESFGVHRLPLVLRQFRESHPQVQLRFTTCEREGLARDLRTGIIDLAFLLDASISAKDLRVEILRSEELLLITHPKHPLAGKPRVPLKDLSGEALILSRVDCSYRLIVEELLRQADIEMDKNLECNSVASIIQCVESGLGITVIPEIAVRSKLAHKKVKAIEWADGPMEVGLLMIWYQEKWISPSLAAFMDTCRQVLAA